MFDDLKGLVSTPSKKVAVKKSLNIPVTTAFVSQLAVNGLRITYAALARASEDLGEHTPSGLSAGQRGAPLAGSLPLELQPFVCNASGSYNKKIVAVFEEAGVDLAEHRSMSYVRPEAIEDFVNLFLIAGDNSDEDEESVDEEASSN